MKRRTFLGQLVTTIPSSLALSSLLLSCSQNNDNVDGIPTNNKYKNYKVLIIGAGAAGLYAGWYLKERGFDVTILEASNRFGGRIKSFDGFADYNIELGAERIYGANTEWFKIVAETGKELNNVKPENYYYFRQNPSDLSEPALKNLSTANQYTDFKDMMSFINQAPNYNGPDVSVESALTSSSPWSMVGVANGLIGNRFGTNNSRLGMRGYSFEVAAKTTDGQISTLKNKTLISVLEDKFSSVFSRIEYNQQVKTIDYSGDPIAVTTKAGQHFSADRVLVTVPLTVLKSGDIGFSPALPNTKVESLEKMDMAAGMKVHIKFSSPFWNSVSMNLGSVFGHHFLPEIYVSNLGRSDTPIITAPIMGERAEQFASMDRSVAISLMLSYLDEIFNGQAPSQSFVQGGYNLIDWSKEPYINGAYSYLKVGGSIIHREELSKPLQNKVFFAGEATNYNGHSGTVHGAIETAIRVISEVEESIV